MLLRQLSLANFRSYSNLDLELNPGLTTITGENGQGKSNLLEAIYFLAIGKSYRASVEKDLIYWHADFIDAYLIIAADIERKEGFSNIRIGLKPYDGSKISKQIRIDGIPRRITDLIGTLNAVLFSPEDMELVFGSPAGRRKYLDILLAQISRNYVRSLSKYQRILLQRNALLKRIKDKAALESELDFWDYSLSSEGAIILRQRVEAMDQLNRSVNTLFNQLSGESNIEIKYSSTVDTDNQQEIESAMIKNLTLSRSYEIQRGSTLVGPHRDDMRLIVKGIDASKHVSRGQARLIALSLRLAESRLLSTMRGDPPIILLDDVFSELDVTRRSLVMDEISTYTQVIITSADSHLLGGKYLGDSTKLLLRNGVLLPEGSSTHGN